MKSVLFFQYFLLTVVELQDGPAELVPIATLLQEKADSHQKG